MTTIVYLHGFASAGDSEKSRAIRARFPDCKVVAPDLPTIPDIPELLKQVAGDENLIFVGTSLGGFWANFFAQLTTSRAVIVNPSTQPSVSLAGAETVNYRTGKLVTVTPDDLAQFISAEKMIRQFYTGSLIDLFLAQDDEVLPYEATLQALPDCKSVKITADGGHRYAQHWDQVLDKIAEYV
jgi:uncharacterized protein